MLLFLHTWYAIEKGIYVLTTHGHPYSLYGKWIFLFIIFFFAHAFLFLHMSGSIIFWLKDFLTKEWQFGQLLHYSGVRYISLSLFFLSFFLKSYINAFQCIILWRHTYFALFVYWKQTYKIPQWQYMYVHFHILSQNVTGACFICVGF